MEAFLSTVDTVTVASGDPSVVAAVGPAVYFPVVVGGVGVDVLVDARLPAVFISREMLQRIALSQKRLGVPVLSLESPQPYHFYGKGGEELAISAMTTLTIEADGARVTVPVFVQPDSSQACLIGMNVLSSLGVTISRASGEPMKLVGGDVTQSSVRLIRAVVPSRKAKFVEATLDVPLVGGETVLFEPAVKFVSIQRVVAPESL